MNMVKDKPFTHQMLSVKNANVMLSKFNSGVTGKGHCILCALMLCGLHFVLRMVRTTANFGLD